MKKNGFMRALIDNLGTNWNNNFENNFDFWRFGSPEREIVDGGSTLLKINKYQEELDWFYSLLEDEYSRFIFVQVLSFRILGHRKIKLPLSTPEYFNAIKTLTTLIDTNNYICATFPEFKNIKLFFFDLNAFGVPVKLFSTPAGIIKQFFIKNYEYRIDTKRSIGAKKGNVVIDGGSCWGDTALFFATEVGNLGQVYAFEFVPSNLDIMRKNLSLNPELAKRIRVVPNPLWSTSGVDLFFKDRGLGSVVENQPFADMQGSFASVSVDHFVDENKIDRVDFIKMDIEGSEQKAIKGAINTLKKYKPQLAISIYHNFPEDFARIAIMLNELQLGYRFFINHFSIHHEETVLFATCEDRL
ncbi:MAG: FkbM family methyltransferase [Deltaproteobacteria bacterium]|nr:FkbM family methyltransferase [Deltaproteobacteria bacterium]